MCRILSNLSKSYICCNSVITIKVTRENTSILSESVIFPGNLT